MKILIMGPQGAGKGTQASRISKKLEVPHISTGDLFREALSNGTDLGAKAKEYMNRGELVPDSIVVGMLKERIEKEDCKKGWILDGYPRNKLQAEELDKITKVSHMIVLTLDDDFAVQRIGGRRTCSKCGAIFHTTNLKPKKEGICDRCGGNLIQREDDKEKAIRERLKIYRNDTEPIILHYKNKGIKMIEVDGKKSIQEAFDEIMPQLR
ncbi:adenylate kinase [Candidatus Woesearchaeota archaeon]|nr:adenylate kinase [Candidatus Woesearchaeota archaeon]